MTEGKVANRGGSIYVGGSGAATIDFSNCATAVTNFESLGDGGFMYNGNSGITLSSSNCCYNHMYAVGNGAFVQGSHLGTFVSSCPQTNMTSNTPTNTYDPNACIFNFLIVSRW